MASAAPSRQTFFGHDDVLLLAHVAHTAPWSHRGGVMEAWQHIAQALNGDAASSLTGLTAAAGRARFFRMVAQRRDRQDKMLRRGTANEDQYQRKLAMLDAVIAQMDAYNDETALHNLLKEVDEDADAESTGATLPLTDVHESLVQVLQKPPVQSRPMMQQPRVASVVPTARSVEKPKPPVQHQPVSTNFGSSKTPSQSNFTRPIHANSIPVQSTIAASSYSSRDTTHRSRQSTSTVVIPPDSPVVSSPTPPSTEARVGTTKSSAHTGPLKPFDGQASSNSGGNWERIAEQAIELMHRKLEVDREAAEAEREWRREEARARMDEMKTIREQNDRLMHAVLELSRSK